MGFLLVGNGSWGNIVSLDGNSSFKLYMYIDVTIYTHYRF